MNQESIFTKMINGDIACHKIYEDNNTFAFLDNHPLQLGHTLVVPKNQVQFVWDLPDGDYQTLMMSVKKIAQRLKDVLGVKYVGLKVEGVEAAHAHVHLIPFNTIEEFEGKLNRPDPHDHAHWSSVAEKLQF